MLVMVGAWGSGGCEHKVGEKVVLVQWWLK